MKKSEDACVPLSDGPTWLEIDARRPLRVIGGLVAALWGCQRARHGWSIECYGNGMYWMQS